MVWDIQKKKLRVTLADELHRPLRRHFPTRRIVVKKLDDTWTADLMFMPKKIKVGETEGFLKILEEEQERGERQTAIEKQTDNLNIFLVVLDVFSRYAWVRQLENKQSINVIKAFKDIFNTSNRKPVKLWTDRGGEFIGMIDKEEEKPATDYQCEHCKKYVETKGGLTRHLREYCPVLFPERAKEEKTRLKGVELYHTEGKHKAAIAERFIKTLKDKIGRWMTNNNSTNYIPHLQEMVKDYNNTPHRSFKEIYTPEEASKQENEEKIYEEFYKNAQPKKFKADRTTQKTPLEVGDLVRIPRRKAEGFEKGFSATWTREIFKIREIKNTNPTTYFLSDANDHHITGVFYRQELQKTRFNFQEWMGDTKPRIKENAILGMEAVRKEAVRQRKKKQEQRKRKKQTAAGLGNQAKGAGLEISKTVRNLPIKSLNNFELTDICKHLKGWRGVFSRDTLPKKPNMYECGILNLDDSGGPGTHWTAWHRNKKLKFYFDSYGLPPPLEFQKYMKSPVLYSSDQIQNPGTMICGHLCVHVLQKLNEGYHIQPVASHLMDLKEKGLI